MFSLVERRDHHRSARRISSRVAMPEGLVRSAVGRAVHRHQPDGPLSHQDESQAQAYGLHQRVLVPHRRRPDGSAVPRRRSSRLNIPVQVHWW